MNNVSFNGAVQLAPKVEKVIREKEFYALRAYAAKLKEDVFVKSREIIGDNDKCTGVLFEGLLKPSNTSIQQVFNIPKF